MPQFCVHNAGMFKFENTLNRKRKRLYRSFLTIENLKANDTNSQMMAFLKFEQDLKNNPKFQSKLNYANNQSALERGCSLNLVKNNHRL